VLVAVVDCYEDSNEPVTTQRIADSLGVATVAVSGPLESLCDFELLCVEETGYRPTVTARELLARGIDLGDIVALDVVPE
jgi:predicted transcriptional regulator